MRERAALLRAGKEVGLPPISSQHQQLPQLDLRIAFGRACLPEPDLAACQRIGPRLHVNAKRPARELLNVTGFSACHAVTVARQRALVPRPGPRLGQEKQSLHRWGGWDLNPRPADYEKYGSVHP